MAASPVTLTIGASSKSLLGVKANAQIGGYLKSIWDKPW